MLARDDLAGEDLGRPQQARRALAVPQAIVDGPFVSEHAAKADLQRFPDNAAAIAAFQSGRVDAVCLFHPPLLAARQTPRQGQARRADPGAIAGVECAARKLTRTFVVWIDEAARRLLPSGQTEKWYEQRSATSASTLRLPRRS